MNRTEDALGQAREIIAEEDRIMARCFVRRMEAVRQIAEWKREQGLPILDAAQEQAVIQRGLAHIDREALRGYYTQFIRGVMKISREYQQQLFDADPTIHPAQGIRVAYSGVEGAYAHIAVRRIFPQGQAIACSDFKAAYEAVEMGECDRCVLPVENSYAGEVGEVTDLMVKGSLRINGMYTLPVEHCLLGMPGSDTTQIRKVISHPQALSQCARYISEHGFEGIQASNTARAAQYVLQNGDPALAAVASRETAALYGLRVLEEGINDSDRNSTRFAVFTKADKAALSEPAAGFLLLFTVKNAIGTLAQALSVIAAHGFNMRTLRSRPLKDQPGDFCFYVEIEGDDRDTAGEGMLDEMKDYCRSLKLVGRYPKEIDLGKGEGA